MKTTILILILFLNFSVFGQRPSCAQLAANVGKDKNSLVTKYNNLGFKKTERLQHLGQNLANRLTKISGIKCNGITLVDKDETQLIYIIYNPSGVCVGFSFGDKTDDNEYDKIDEEILSLNYTNNNNSYINQDSGSARSYTKGKKFFVLARYSQMGGYSVTAHSVTPK